MSEVELVWVPDKAEELISYMARVSNPKNENNTETAPRLLRYLIKHKHWSPFELVALCVKIKCSRAIGRQLLRHRSFTFQEFSLRYSEPEFDPLLHTVDTRMQSTKNRQDSTFCMDDELMKWWVEHQMHVAATAQQVYKRAVQKGIAKELARAVLPEGLTPTTIYMQGTLRSWIHFTQLRLAKGSQLEIREIALQINNIIAKYFPNIHEALQQEDQVFDIKNYYELSADYIDES